MIKPLDLLGTPAAAAPRSAPRGKGFKGHLADVDAAQRAAQSLTAAGHQGIDAHDDALGHRSGAHHDALGGAGAHDNALGAPGHRGHAAQSAAGHRPSPARPDATLDPTGNAATPMGDATDDQTAPNAAAAVTAVGDAPRADSPVAALLAAAVGRAIGSLRTAPATTPPPAIAEPTAAPITLLTPLEQAVHDLIAIAHAEPQHDERRPHDDDREPAIPVLASPATIATPEDAPGPAPAHAAAPIVAPEPPANPSHVHLVLDDGPERVVVTVAVRGSDVHVALRGGDDATAASLARNAASLDHAMRARGMQLSDFTHERESPRDRPQHSDPERRHQRRDQAERFTLEKDTP